MEVVGTESCLKAVDYISIASHTFKSDQGLCDLLKTGLKTENPCLFFTTVLMNLDQRIDDSKSHHAFV